MTSRSSNGSGAASAALDAATRCAGKGWPVFPCRPGGKAPATPNGFKDATLDVGLIQGWFEQYPDANLAVATGAVSGLVVLDVDGEEGFESFRKLGAVPDTLLVITPRGGMHLYFEHPGGRVRCSAGRLGAGLDVRADGGYVLVPPSVVNGVAYETGNRAPIAPLGRLLEAEPAFKGRAPISELARMMDGGIPYGQRNAGIAKLVGYLLARSVDAHLVQAIARNIGERSLDDRGQPLPREEVDNIFESIAGRELRKRRERGW